MKRTGTPRKPLVEFPGGSVVKNPPANAGDTGEEDSLEEEMAMHSSILAGIILWIEEAGGP